MKSKKWMTFAMGVLALAACDDDPVQPGSALALEGVWTVASDAGSPIGLDGPTTLEFGASAGGQAELRTQSAASGITNCSNEVYAIVNDDVIALDDEFFVVDASVTDRLVLSNDDRTLTLDRVAGTPPVDACVEVEATEVLTFDFEAGSFTNLNAVGDRLYFNLDGSTDSIVSYDTQSNALGLSRAYTQSVSGGNHRWVVGASTDSLFYGHCGCGGSQSVDYFDLDVDASLAVVDTDSDLGIDLSVRYGYFDGTNIVVGGRDRTDFVVNRLLTLDGTGLTLVSQREVLAEAGIADITIQGGALFALVGSYVVRIGTDGRADESFKVTGLTGVFPRGVAAVGDDLYLLGENGVGDAVLYEVALP